MKVSFPRNGADSIDGALVRFETGADFGAFDMTGAVWDAKRGCVAFDPGGGGDTGVAQSPEVKVEGGFDHVLPSWNAMTPVGSYLVIYAQARVNGEWTKWYNLGIWNTAGCPRHRTSVKDQKDDRGDVDTDVLKLDKPADAFKVKVELCSADGKSYPCLRFLSVNVIDSSLEAVDLPPLKAVWGRELDVPALAQISVVGGSGWCSPTSTAMLLNYWSGKLNRPDLAVGVTETANAIHDEAWGGTGNWPFNTACASENAGIRGYVTRFASVSQIERWIEKGVPVIVSVKPSRMRRDESDSDPGHLMVIRGFTADGDPIFNDPWPRDGKSEDAPRQYPIEDLRKVFKREDLEHAWLGSGASWGTVYLIYPEGM